MVEKIIQYFAILFILSFPCAALAVGETATTQSVLYLASAGNRNATLEVDAAFFNPAGLAFIEENIVLCMLGNQVLFQTKKIKDAGVPDGKEYEGEVRSYVFPTAAAAFRRDSFAFYFHGGPYGGSGIGNFKDGTPTSAGMSVKVQPAILGATIGAAYRLTETLAAAAGVKYFYADKTMELSDSIGTFTSEATGSGFGLTAGLNLKPDEKLNIGFQFMWNSKLETANETKKSSGTTPALAGEAYFPDGDKSRAQLPMLAMIGISYAVLPDLKVEIDGLLYFEWLNDLGKVEPDPLMPEASKDAAGDDISEHYGHGFEAGIGIEYVLMPGKLTLNTGYMYGRNGQKREVIDDFSYYQDYNQFGIGGTMQITDEIGIMAGYMIAVMFPGKKSWDGRQEYIDEPAHFFGLGVKGKFSI
jgi:long-chain fatty acid transport protein